MGLRPPEPRMHLTQAIVEAALTDDWQASRMIADRIGVSRGQETPKDALRALTAKRRILRRETRRGNGRFEYRLP